MPWNTPHDEGCVARRGRLGGNGIRCNGAVGSDAVAFKGTETKRSRRCEVWADPIFGLNYSEFGEYQMLTHSLVAVSAVRRMAVATLVLALVVVLCPLVHGQVIQSAIGGVSVMPNGLLDNATVDNLFRLSRLRAEASEPVPAAMQNATPLRRVSLRRLEAAIQDCQANGKELPDEIKYLAGLQQIRHVFVYPEQHDIVLVGPGEGWKIDKQGNVVGAFNGRPVMLLDDLLVALRTARGAADGGITCSINPTAEGLVRIAKLRLQTGDDPRRAAATMEQLLGPQRITFTGVPVTSHFARVLVAADYRMKRLGMGFEKAPVRGLPSYLSMLRSSARSGSMAPRWWMEPAYEPILCSPDRLAWEFRGGSVKTLTEDGMILASGERRGVVRTNATAQRWADLMTEKYDELAVAEPIFGQLRNCMELAIVGALIVKERLADRAGYSMPLLLDGATLTTDVYPAPSQIATKASLVRKGRTWMISASGGVALHSWGIVDRVEKTDALAAVKAEVAGNKNDAWWWN